MGNLEEKYVLARYRVWIDAAQYRRLVAFIQQRKAHPAPWHAFLNNCVTFGRDVAALLNLNIPLLMRVSPAVVMYPESVVGWIRDANGGDKDQGPLKDAPGALPAAVVAKLHANATTQVANTNTTGTTAVGAEKPAVSKKQFANKPEENKASAIH